MDQDEWEDFEQVQIDPRKDEDWKIQKRKGFLKDQESKVQQVQQAKLSKTARRNSKEPMFNDNNKDKSYNRETTSVENTFDFLDDIISGATPVVPMPGTKQD